MASQDFKGDVSVAAPPETVFRALLEPHLWQAALPELTSFTWATAHKADLEASMRIGPMTHRLRTKVTITRAVPPQLIAFHRGGVEPYAGAGAFTGELAIEPAAGGGSRLGYALVLELGRFGGVLRVALGMMRPPMGERVQAVIEAFARLIETEADAGAPSARPQAPA